MKKPILVGFVLFWGFICYSQQIDVFNRDGLFLSPEVQFGITLPSNSNFPKTTVQKSLNINLCKKNYSPEKKWTTLLNYPTTGVLVSYTDFGNLEKVGTAISVSPFAEFNFKKPLFSHWSLKTGLGISYINKLYHPLNNANNKAIITHANYIFYLYTNYQLIVNKKFPIKIGGGYVHHSNGHIKLPNMGLNSAIISITSDFSYKNSKLNIEENIITIPKSYQTYFEYKTGLGYQDFLSNNHAKKNVSALSFSAGTVYKDLYKLGIGVSYRKYQHYYDYIIANKMDRFFEKPNLYASNVFLYLNTELLMDHVGINIDWGLNLFKPFYETHYFIEEGSLDGKYKMKKMFLGRMGMKLYLNTTRKLPANNLFIGAHINSNLSQADFFEFSVGFTHRLLIKKPKRAITKLVLRDIAP